MLSERCPTTSPPVSLRTHIIAELKGLPLKLARQVRRLRGRLVLSGMVIALVLSTVLLAHSMSQVPVTVLMRDIFVLVEQPVYVGLVSNLGIVLWAGAATIWGAAAWMARQSPEQHRLAAFTFWSMVLTLVLLADDALMLHEAVLLQAFGIRESIAVLGLGLFVLAYGCRFGWQLVRETAILPALLAGGCLAASIGVDRVMAYGEWQTLIEDGLKFAGIVFWFTYAATVFEQLWREHSRPAPY